MRKGLEVLVRPIQESYNIEDKETFEFIFKKFYVTLCYFAFDYVGNKEIAEDIVGDLFLKLWEEKSTLKINTSLKSYLFKAVQNHCLNYNKHQIVIKKFESSLSNDYKNDKKSFSDSKNNLPNYLIAQEIQDKIEQSISILPAQCQQIFKLNRFENLKYKDIANKLNISVKTVETQMYRALKKIKDFLKDYLE